MPAKCMYSYSVTLYSILDAFKPSTVFEWGPGISTQIMALYPSVSKVDSVENEAIFYDMIERLNYGNVNFHLHTNMDDYINALSSSYDFVFVDGRNRSECLDRASLFSPLVMLHDAARADYRDAVMRYPFRAWTDEGNTVCLTHNEEIYSSLKKCLDSLECSEPGVEHIYFNPKAVFKGMTP